MSFTIDASQSWEEEDQQASWRANHCHARLYKDPFKISAAAKLIHLSTWWKWWTTFQINSVVHSLKPFPFCFCFLFFLNKWLATFLFDCTTWPCCLFFCFGKFLNSKRWVYVKRQIKARVQHEYLTSSEYIYICAYQRKGIKLMTYNALYNNNEIWAVQHIVRKLREAL